MEVSRRSLFRFGAAALLTAAVSPVSNLVAPVLWGDGIHDDTAALQALMDGKPVSVSGSTIIAREGVLDGGSYLLTNTLRISGENILISNARFTLRGKTAKSVIAFHNCKAAVVQNCIISVEEMAADGAALWFDSAETFNMVARPA